MGYTYWRTLSHSQGVGLCMSSRFLKITNNKSIKQKFFRQSVTKIIRTSAILLFFFLLLPWQYCVKIRTLGWSFLVCSQHWIEERGGLLQRVSEISIIFCQWLQLQKSAICTKLNSYIVFNFIKVLPLFW